MNNINILGTITREPELKYTQSGTAILSFGIAYNEKRKQQDGSYTDFAHFFDVASIGKKAEVINQWFRKGSRILIQGSLDYQSWNAQDGSKKSKVGIKLEDFDFIDKREANNSEANQAPQQGGYGGNQYQSPQSNQTNQQQYPQGYNKHTAYREPQGHVQMPSRDALLDIDMDEDTIPF